MGGDLELEERFRGCKLEEEFPSKQRKVKEVDEVITFAWADARVQYPHNDPMVKSMNITNYDVNHVLVDNECSVDVLFYDALSKMGISSALLKGAYRPLSESPGSRYRSRGSSRYP